jgi:sugar transferase (PEP-CTERM/EpsH1 system associated)
MSGRGRARVLWITPKPPLPLVSGDRIRQYNLIRRLAEGHDVDLVTFVDGAADRDGVAALDGLCRRVIAVPLPPRPCLAARALAVLDPRAPFRWARYRSPLFRGALEALTARERYDVVDVQHVYMAPYFAAVRPGPRRVLTLHNVESVLSARCGAVERSAARRAYWTIESRKLAAFERSWLPAVDAVVAMSDDDAAAARRAAPPAAVAVVPNGVDIAAYAPHVDGRDDRAVVFTGSLGYPPNADGVRWFLARVWPLVRVRRPDATCTIVGRDPSAELRARDGRDGVRVTGLVDDVRRFLVRAGAAVVPLRAGGGTRLKILEAMASATPVVSTRLGAEGLALRDGVEICLADDPLAFATATLRVLRDPALRRRLGEAARRRAEDTYDWRFSADALARVYGTAGRSVPACAS